MMIHEITAKAGRHKARKRIGRGRGSGVGKTSGRGHKGQQSRAGASRRPQFEGGQMPYFRRIPKRGFTNFQFTTRFWIVNLGDVAAHTDFQKGGEVTPKLLVKAGLIRDEKRPVKVLAGFKGEPTLPAKLEITAARISKKAKELVEAAGGSANETGTARDRVRGIDRASGDLTPKNLTKKRKRMNAKKIVASADAKTSDKKSKKKKSK